MTSKFIFQFLSLALFIAGCSSNVSSQSGAQVGKTAEVKQIDAAQFVQMAKDSNTVIIDVRTPGEVAEGYIPGATKFIDYNGSDFESQIMGLDTNKTYLVYCKSGNRSGKATTFMVQHGFKNVCNLQGGISAWPGEIKKD